MRLIVKPALGALILFWLSLSVSGHSQGLASALPKPTKVPPVEDVIQLRIERVTSNRVVLDLVADPALYVYRDKLSFKPSKGAGFSTGTPSLPKGTRITDEFFGNVEVLRGAQVIEVPIKGKTTGALVGTVVACHAEAKICYPPYQVSLVLAPARVEKSAKNTLTPAKNAEKAVKTGEPYVVVKTSAALDAALAKNKGKFAVVDFWATWCVPCKQMEKTTFADPAVKSLLESEFTLIKVDVSETGPASAALLKRFGFAGPPGFAFYGKDGKEIGGGRLMGFIPPERFLQQLNVVRS
jgi:thiol:disulfide interchange protein